MSSSKQVQVASGWQQNTQPLFDALVEAGLKPEMTCEPNQVGVATCITVPERYRSKARTFAQIWNAAISAAREASHPSQVERVSTYELGG